MACCHLMFVTLSWSRVSLDYGKHVGVRRCSVFIEWLNDEKFSKYDDGQLYQAAMSGMRSRTSEDGCATH